MSYLRTLNDDPLFRALLDAVSAARPTLPSFDPTADNTDEWKVRSGMQQGFDLCLNHFKLE